MLPSVVRPGKDSSGKGKIKDTEEGELGVCQENLVIDHESQERWEGLLEIRL